MEKLKAAVILARPHQYLKNAFVWAPAFFGYQLTNRDALSKSLWAFLCFCLAASAIYIFNDLHDVEEDRNHPKKKYRPLACGAISPREALAMLAFLIVLTITLSASFLNVEFLFILAIYLILNVIYSFWLKHIAIIDITCIAIAFVLRIFAGGAVTGIQVSHWLILMVFLLALFLALAKRLDDLRLDVVDKGMLRRSLNGYNLELVQSSMIVMMSVIIVSYISYTVSPEVIDKHGTNNLYLTSFWVVIGLLRYMQITLVHQKSGSPTLVLIKDGFIRWVVILWLASFYLVLYVYSI